MKQKYNFEKKCQFRNKKCRFRNKNVDFETEMSILKKKNVDAETKILIFVVIFPHWKKP